MKFLTPFVNETIDNRFARVTQPFRFYSDLLKEIGYNDGVGEMPAGMIHDFESVPVIKGTSQRGGGIHDYYSRKNSKPVLTKKQAADIYFEAMEARDVLYGKDSVEELNEERGLLQRFSAWSRRNIKYWVVRVWPGYFHEHLVEATYEEMKGDRTTMRRKTPRGKCKICGYRRFAAGLILYNNFRNAQGICRKCLNKQIADKPVR